MLMRLIDLQADCNVALDIDIVIAANACALVLSAVLCTRRSLGSLRGDSEFQANFQS